MSMLPKYVAAFGITAAAAYGVKTVVTDQKFFGGGIPSTRNEEWQSATAEYLKSLPRESNGGPVVMNPILNGVRP
eukprot:CAMPEP_0118921072 /NCGR_PEP_ID=MMETSP1169-20130426/460_1 /TAXON_ID=36882 /ORGANISM="Pyramimonas obovata, Strain CCMP722" /LENGTH=74 /DNA_ID=CAMNT_0006861727 /DNA_START=82 /DNA_END=306 /DNA_ORIENTATION=+